MSRTALMMTQAVSCSRIFLDGAADARVRRHGL